MKPELIPLDLARALAGDKLITRDGKAVMGFRRRERCQPGDYEYACNHGCYTAEGRFWKYVESQQDLFMAEPCKTAEPARTAEPAVSDWQPWSGGECPVSEGTLVDVRYRCWQTGYKIPALVDDPDFSFFAIQSNWENDDCGYDIIAWRLSAPAEVKAAEPADPYAEFKAAYKAGKTLQTRGYHPDSWTDLKTVPVWCDPPDRYRIKPWSLAEHLKTLPGWTSDMKCKNPEKWVESDLKDGFRPLFFGERIESGDEYWYSGIGPWILESSNGIFREDHVRYRTKRPIVAPPVTPATPEDRKDAWFPQKGDKYWFKYLIGDNAWTGPEKAFSPGEMYERMVLKGTHIFSPTDPRIGKAEGALLNPDEFDLENTHDKHLSAHAILLAAALSPEQPNNPTDTNNMNTNTASAAPVHIEMPRLKSKWLILNRDGSGSYRAKVKSVGEEGLLLLNEAGAEVHLSATDWVRRNPVPLSRKERRQQAKAVRQGYRDRNHSVAPAMVWDPYRGENVPVLVPKEAPAKPSVSTLAAFWKLYKVGTFVAGLFMQTKWMWPFGVAAYYYLTAKLRGE